MKNTNCWLLLKNLNVWTTGPIFSHGQQLAGARSDYPFEWGLCSPRAFCCRSYYWFIFHRYLGGMLIIIHLATCFVIILHRTHFHLFTHTSVPSRDVLCKLSSRYRQPWSSKVPLTGYIMLTYLPNLASGKWEWYKNTHSQVCAY